MIKLLLSILLFLSFQIVLSAQPQVIDIQPQGGGTTLAVACTGQTIRVVGVGFQTSGMTITINSGVVISSYNFINTSNIELVVPAATPLAGLGVIVTNVLPSLPRVLAINPPPTIVSSPTQQNVCEGSLFSFSVVASGGTLGYLWKKNGIGTTGILPLYSGIAAATDSGDVYTVQITDLLCATTITSTPVKLIVNTKPNNPATLPDLHNCANGNFSLNAPVPSIGTGSWSCMLNCTGINLANASNPNTLVTGVTQALAPVLQWMVTNGACSASSLVNIINDPMPTSTAVIYGNDTSICLTSPPVNLAANAAAGIFTSKAWSLQGPLTGSFSSPANNSTNFIPTSGAGVYKINYTIYNGSCSSTSSTKRIIVYDTVIVNAGGNPTACFGVPLNTIGNVSNASSYSWSLVGNHGTLAGGSGLTPTYNSNGDDSLGVNITLTLTASNVGCGSSSDTATITIHPKPHAIIPIGTNAIICFGATASIPITLTGTPPYTGLGLDDGSTILNLGTISGNSSNQIVTPVANANYTLVSVGGFKDANNCNGALRGHSAITVLPAPSATLSITPSTICYGNNTQLTITPSGGGSVWRVYMNTGGSNTMQTLTGSYTNTINPTSSITYYIDSIETSTCGKIKLNGISQSVTVNTPPVVSSTLISTSDDTLCNGENSIVSISGLQSNTVYTIKNYSNQAMDSIIIGNTVPGNASVTIPFSKFTSGSMDTLHFVARSPGCSTLASSVIKVPVWLSTLQVPVVSVSAVMGNCDRKILQLSNQPGITYQWYEGINLMAGNESYKDTIYFSGNYLVKVKDSLSCEFSSNTIVVDYSALSPVVSGTIISATETKLSTSSVATTYYWYVQTNLGIKKIQGANLNSIPVYFDGNYYLGTANNSCFFLSQPYTVSGKTGGSLLRLSLVETDSTVFLPAPDWNTEASVYPNPVFNSDFTVDYWTEEEATTVITLYNPQGIAVLQKEKTGMGSTRTSISSKGFPSGIYNLVISDGTRHIRKSLMIY